MKSKILLLVIYVFTVSLYAQKNLNAYKYIIVPKKFDFQKSNDKYQLNSLTKFLFNKEGFTAVFEGDEMPKDLFDNPCLGLKANVENTSGMLTTKLIIALLDCRNANIFTSLEGKSKIKDFKKSYHEALRKAFQSFKRVNYKYDSSLAIAEKKEEEAVEVVPIPLVEDEVPKATVVDASGEALDFEKIEPVDEVQSAAIAGVAVAGEVSQSNDQTNLEPDISQPILYAQAKPFGFQLVDSAPSVAFLLQKTSQKDVYILKNKNGIIYKKNDKWIAEYYEADTLIQKELQIKF